MFVNQYNSLRSLIDELYNKIRAIAKSSAGSSAAFANHKQYTNGAGISGGGGIVAFDSPTSFTLTVGGSGWVDVTVWISVDGVNAGDVLQAQVRVDGVPVGSAGGGFIAAAATGGFWAGGLNILTQLAPGSSHTFGVEVTNQTSATRSPSVAAAQQLGVTVQELG
jgi:hypothetical protein